MSGTYKATGINLKSTPLGESDRLLTILTEEFGLVRAVAPGARKHHSSLGGRSSLFVVNQLLIAKGRNLDKVIQAESLESYPGLSQDLGKLTASQYLAELALHQALSDHPQVELVCLLREHLSRLEQWPRSMTLACLAHAIFHLLALAGLAPQVHACCMTQEPIVPNFGEPDWWVAFSSLAGGTVYPSELAQLAAEQAGKPLHADEGSHSPEGSPQTLPKTASSHRVTISPRSSTKLYTQLSAGELYLLQQLTQPDLTVPTPESENGADDDDPFNLQIWLVIERILRQYAEYHFDRPIRSASLIDTCFAAANAPSLIHHDATA